MYLSNGDVVQLIKCDTCPLRASMRKQTYTVDVRQTNALPGNN